MSEYPDSEFPWTFYFNGVALPKWGACWGMADICSFIDLRDSWDWDVGPRDISIINCRIDHVGVVESADPDIFRYAVQEVLCIFLDKREAVFEKLKRGWDFPADPDEVYNGLVEAAVQMRELTIRDGRAFWISGYEPDRLQLVEAIRRASLPSGDPEYAPAPHVSSLRSDLESLWRQQAKTLHRMASAGGVSKEFRKRLLEVTTFLKKRVAQWRFTGKRREHEEGQTAGAGARRGKMEIKEVGDYRELVRGPNDK